MVKLIRFTDKDGHALFVNPDFVVGVQELKTTIGIIGEKPMTLSAIHMTNMDGNRVQGTAEEIAGVLSGEQETPEAP